MRSLQTGNKLVYLHYERIIYKEAEAYSLAVRESMTQSCATVGRRLVKLPSCHIFLFTNLSSKKSMFVELLLSFRGFVVRQITGLSIVKREEEYVLLDALPKKITKIKKQKSTVSKKESVKENEKWSAVFTLAPKREQLIIVDKVELPSVCSYQLSHK
mmetsp:Transcript_21486/g.33158  ORF Transcript_21486/g.33158 Transcript_21486/m.33158 type:complete len:158 (-) Transcript_21486:22-495(-)